MRYIIIVIICGYFVSQTCGQIADTLSITKTFTGNLYLYRGQEINPNDISFMLENYPEAFDLFESSRESRFFGNLFAILGTGLVVIPVALSFSSINVQWGYAYTGVGFLGLTIPVFKTYHKKSTEAVRLYNQAVQTPQKPAEITSYYFGATANGVGLQIKF